MESSHFRLSRNGCFFWRAHLLYRPHLITTPVIDCRNFFGLDNFNVADVLSHCRSFTVSLFVDMIHHFCISDEDFTFPA